MAQSRRSLILEEAEESRASGRPEGELRFKACYSWAKDGVVMIIIATHVVYLVWACHSEAEECITIIKSMLTLGAESEYSFRYWQGD